MTLNRFEEFVDLLRSCYGVCSADLFNRPYFCTAYPISDLHCQARLYARYWTCPQLPLAYTKVNR